MVDAPLRWCCQEGEQVCWIWGWLLAQRRCVGFQGIACASAYLGKEKSKNSAQRRIRQLLVLLIQVRRQGPDGFPSVVVQLGGESGPVRHRRGERKRLKKAVAYGR